MKVQLFTAPQKQCENLFQSQIYTQFGCYFGNLLCLACICLSPTWSRTCV